MSFYKYYEIYIQIFFLVELLFLPVLVTKLVLISQFKILHKFFHRCFYFLLF